MAGQVIKFSKKYLQFFIKNYESRHVIIQGSRRSGKSFSVYKWLLFLGSAKTQVIYVVAASFPALQLAINDFQRATGMIVGGSAIYGYSCILSNGTQFVFRSFDSPTKAQGSSMDILYLEETLNIPEQIIDVLSMSVTKQIYMCYNPTKKSFIDKYILPDKSNYLVTTWKDNAFLTEEQKSEFEGIRERAMKPTASILDIYNYKVYYCGEFSDMSGKVFNQVYTCTDEEYESIKSQEYYGMDFGFVDSKDKTTLVGIKQHEGCIYIREYIYSSHLTNNYDLAMEMASKGLDCYSYICADYGGLGKERIKALCSAGGYTWTDSEINRGFNVINAKKGKIADGLNKMLQYEKIVVTSSSVNLRNEMDNYELSESGSAKGSDHALDAARYAVNTYL